MHDRNPRGPASRTTQARPGAPKPKGAQIMARCPACTHSFRVPAGSAGEDVRCPRCKRPFEVDSESPLTMTTLGEMAEIPTVKGPSRVVRRSGPTEEDTEVDIQRAERVKKISGRLVAAAAAQLRKTGPASAAGLPSFAAVDVPFPPIARNDRAPRPLTDQFRTALLRSRQPKAAMWFAFALLGGVIGARFVPDIPVLGAIVGVGAVLVIVLAWWGMLRMRTARHSAVPAEVMMSIPLLEWRLCSLRWASNPAAYAAVAGSGKGKAAGLYTRLALLRAPTMQYAKKGDNIWVAIPEAHKPHATILPFHLAHVVAQGHDRPFVAEMRPKLPCPKCRGRRIGNPLMWPFRLFVMLTLLLLAVNLIGATMVAFTHLGVGIPAIAAGAAGLILSLTALNVLWPPVGCDACRVTGKLKELRTWTWTERLLAGVSFGIVALTPLGWAVERARCGIEELDALAIATGALVEANAEGAAGEAEAGDGDGDGSADGDESARDSAGERAGDADPEADANPDLTEQLARARERLTALREGEVPNVAIDAPSVIAFADALQLYLEASDDASRAQAGKRVRETRNACKPLHRIGYAAPTLWKGQAMRLDGRVPPTLVADTQAFVVNIFEPVRAFAESVGLDLAFWDSLLPPKDRYPVPAQ